MKQYHSVYSPRFPFVVVLLCVLLSVDTTLGSSNHDDLSPEGTGPRREDDRVKDRSAEEQAHLYMVYKLHVLGATSKELAKYETNGFNIWSCCKDDATSTGCHTNDDDTVDDHVDYCQANSTAKPAGINTECYIEGWGSSTICCQSWPDNHVGSKAWPWDKCV